MSVTHCFDLGGKIIKFEERKQYWLSIKQRLFHFLIQAAYKHVHVILQYLLHVSIMHCYICTQCAHIFDGQHHDGSYNGHPN